MFCKSLRILLLKGFLPYSTYLDRIEVDVDVHEMGWQDMGSDTNCNVPFFRNHFTLLNRKILGKFFFFFKTYQCSERY